MNLDNADLMVLRGELLKNYKYQVKKRAAISNCSHYISKKLSWGFLTYD